MMKVLTQTDSLLSVKLKKGERSFDLALLGDRAHLELIVTEAISLDFLPRELESLSIVGPVSDIHLLGEFKNLKKLRLKRSQISKLPESLGELTKLEILSLTDSQFSFLPESVSYLTELKTLEIPRNKVVDLPKMINLLISLERVNLDGNQITDLPVGFYLLPKLTHLSLDGNPISEECKGQLYERFNLVFE